MRSMLGRVWQESVLLTMLKVSYGKVTSALHVCINAIQTCFAV